MKLNKIISIAFALSILTACGGCSDNSPTSETSITESASNVSEFRKVGFYKDKISINVKPEWEYKIDDSSLMVKAQNDKSNLYITAEDLDYDLGEIDFANIYNKMKSGAKNIMRVTKLTPLEDTDMYSFSFYDLEASATVHVYMFAADGTLFTMYFGEDSNTKQGDIVKNIVSVLDPIIIARLK